MDARGIIVKIKKRSCIVLTPEGEYREVPLPGDGTASVGREIILKRRKGFPYFRHLAAVASLLLFVLAGQIYLAQTRSAAAYLTIDINPSIELAVSADRRVVAACGLNEGGRKILKEIEVRGRDLLEATGLILERAIADRYLEEKDDNVILVTLTVDIDKEYLVDLESVYKAVQRQVDSGGLDAEIIIQPVKPETRREAAKSGISAGRYFLLQKLNTKGIDVSAGEIRSMSLGKLEKEKKVSLIDLLKEEDEGKEHGFNSPGKGKEGMRTKGGIYVERRNTKTGEKTSEKSFTAGKTQENDEGVDAAASEGVRRDEQEEQKRAHRNNDGNKSKDGYNHSPKNKDRK